MRYLKVSPKTNKILSDENLLSTMTVLKIISRCIKQKISIIYLDESTIININNNLKTWIIPGETLYSEIEPRKKYNLIMAINENGVIHYEINSQNTNDEIFLSFIKNLIIKIDEKKIFKFALFLDNLSCHKTNKVIKFFADKKINIIFNSSYLSSFNSIELAFRGLKNIIYKTIYKSMDSLKEDIKNILDSIDFQKTIRYNYKETISEYLKIYKEYKDYNFNKFKK